MRTIERKCIKKIAKKTNTNLINPRLDYIC